MKCYSKNQIYHITHKIYDFIRENPDHIIIVNLDRNTIGLYEPENAMISLDPRGPVVPVLIHKCCDRFFAIELKSQVVA